MSEDEFELYIESVGSLPAYEIFLTAVEELEKRLKEVKDKVGESIA